MKPSQVTTAFIIDRRRAKSDGTYPVKIRLIYKQKIRKFGTSLSVKIPAPPKIDWGKMQKDERKNTLAKFEHEDKKALREHKKVINGLESNAWEIIKSMPEFSFEAFADKWRDKQPETGNPNDVFISFQREIEQMERANRVGNAYAYKCALVSIKKFNRTENLTFDKVSVKFLNDYETYMITERDKRKGNSMTTVGIYLRCLRAIYNKAIADGVVRPEQYPFGSKKGKYSIPSPRNIKKALTMTDIKKIFDYTPFTDSECLYRDLWIFSYLCNGANMKDICLLKFGDISGDTITFRRAKTSNTNRNTKPITAAYSSHLRNIVTRWGNTPQEMSAFIFPFLKHGDNEQRIKNRVADVVKLVNKYIKRIAKETGIQCNVTTYTARHSFATTLKRAGVNVSFISESMGHSNIQTTESYLGSIEDDQRNEIAGLLIKF